MNYKRLLNTKVGIIFISIMLGLGLAVLFRSACNGKDCLTFKGPSFNDINGKTYQFGDSCYKYHTVSSNCDKNKQILEFTNNKNNKSIEGMDPSVPSSMPSSMPTTPIPSNMSSSNMSSSNMSSIPSNMPTKAVSFYDSFFSKFQNFWNSLTQYFYYTLD